MSRLAWTSIVLPLALFACGAPDRTVDAYADPVQVDLGSLPVDGGVLSFEVTIANTGTGDGEITALELVGEDLSFVALEPAQELPLAVPAGDVVRIPIAVTNLDQLPDGWIEQALSLEVAMDSTWATGGCGGGSAPAADDLVVPITFAVPDGCDADEDGHRSALCGGEDCDDNDPTVYPGGLEVCDQQDNDCDGEIDGPDSFGASSWYADVDADGFGAGTGLVGCEAPGPGYVDVDGDCDDANPAIAPDATETCNSGVDDNCDGLADDDDPSLDVNSTTRFWADRDGDLWGDASDSQLACEEPVGHTGRPGDCDDARTFVNPDGTEVCDGVLDEDCDNVVDETGATGTSTFYADRDGDTFGDGRSSQRACTAPTGFVSDNTDCDDSSTDVYPGAEEVCNGTSDDCDAAIDEDAGDIWYADRDGDGWGNDADSTLSCSPVAGHVLDGGDCNDASFRFNPGVEDPCDDPRDLDCDGAPEDGCSSCEEILASGVGDADGPYSLDVDVDGDGSADAQVDTWCDMTTDGGGWTLVQRTVWDWSSSQQLYTGFDAWVAQPLGVPSAGAYRLPGGVWPQAAELGDMMAVHQVREVGGGSCEPLYYAGSGGTLTVDVIGRSAQMIGLTSNVTLAATSLTTTDSGPSQGCARASGVPWFYGSCCSTCPTYKGTHWADEPHPMVNYAGAVPDLFGRTTADACPGTPVEPDNGANFVGVDSMEIFLR